MYLFVVALVLLFQNSAKPAHGQHKADQSDHRIADPTQPVSVGKAVGSGNKESPTSQTDKKDEYDPRRDRLYRWYLRATIIGVVGGFIGIGVLIWQAILNRRSANAALMNAEAVINAERAWIDIDLIRAGPIYKFILTNRGKTHGIVSKLTLIYDQMTKEDYKALPRRLEAQEEWGSREPLEMYNMLMPNRPTEMRKLDLSLYFSKIQPERIALFSVVVEYDAIGGPYRTEVVYMVQWDILNRAFELIDIPGFTNYSEIIEHT
jgi:hypothetical protein